MLLRELFISTFAGHNTVDVRLSLHGTAARGLLEKNPTISHKHAAAGPYKLIVGSQFLCNFLACSAFLLFPCHDY
jgi:hypothetical protein